MTNWDNEIFKEISGIDAEAELGDKKKEYETVISVCLNGSRVRVLGKTYKMVELLEPIDGKKFKLVEVTDE